jgi:hypothetical protein
MMVRMRFVVALACSVAVLAPAGARADLKGCLLGPCQVKGPEAAILAAIAAPVLVVGAAVTAIRELNKPTDERVSLDLIPPAQDRYRIDPKRERSPQPPSAAFRFNETATNVALVATGAAVTAAMISGIVKSARK